MDHNTERRFMPQPAIGNMPERMTNLRSWIMETAEFLHQAVPYECRERSLALTHLEEALMWGNKAIVLGDATVEPPA